MKFDLKAEFEFSKPLDSNAKKALAHLLKQADADLFKRGCPPGKEKEAGRLREAKLSGNKLNVHIESGRYVRAHTCIARLRNELAKTLGKDFHIGIKSITPKSYRITIPIVKVTPKVTAIPFVQKAERKGKFLLLKLHNTNLEKYEATIDNAIKLLNEKTKELPKAKEVHREVWYTGEKPMFTEENVSEILERKGWVQHFAAGVFHYLPPYAKILRLFEKLVIDEVARPLGFEEIVLPKLIPLEIMKKKGQLTGIPEEMFYVSEPGKRDIKHFEPYVNYVKVTGDVSPDKLRPFLRSPRYALPYAQCEPFYQIFAEGITDADKFPYKFYDKSGFSFRYEAGGKSGMERLNAFTRVEIAYIGLPEQVTEIRKQVLEKMQKLYSETLDLECRIVETTPVWLSHSDPNAEIDKTAVPGTFDIEAYIPCRGTRQASEWLEISNASVSFSKYHEKYSIREKSKREAWTGCAGAGLERLVFAFLSQKGFDQSKWPKKVLEALGELPKPPELLDWPKER